jgi:hypothetical protein
MKRRNTVIARPVVKEGPTIRILKHSACPSLSGKSSLVYEVGLDETTKNVQLRVVANSGGGTWSNEWQTLDDIRKALDRVPKGQPVTADALIPLFRGASQNSPYFLAAALKHVGMIVPSETKKRCYERAEPRAFLDEMKGIIEGKPATDAKPKKATAKPQGKDTAKSHSESPSASSKKKRAKG